MGKILKPRGLKGVLWFVPFNVIDSSLKPKINVWINLKGKKYQNFLVESLEISERKSWIKFFEYDNREDVGGFIGLNFSIKRTDFSDISNNESYLVDLIGVKVFDIKKKYLGLVVDTFVLPANNLLVVDINGKEVLIPFVDYHVSFFDKKKNILILEDVEGLLN